MRLYTILTKIIQLIFSRKNSYYTTTNEVSAVKGQMFDVATIKVAKGTYLVLGNILGNVSDASEILLSYLYADGGNRIVMGLGRSTLAGGGGCNSWMLADFPNGGTIRLTSHGYYAGAWKCSGAILAVKLI